MGKLGNFPIFFTNVAVCLDHMSDLTGMCTQWPTDRNLLPSPTTILLLFITQHLQLYNVINYFYYVVCHGRLLQTLADNIRSLYLKLCIVLVASVHKALGGRNNFEPMS